MDLALANGLAMPLKQRFPMYPFGTGNTAFFALDIDLYKVYVLYSITKFDKSANIFMISKTNNENGSCKVLHKVVMYIMW